MTVTAQILDQIVEVRRVEDGQFTNVEPEFDGTWPKLTKLEWQCAVVELDCGIRPRVSPALLHVNGHNQAPRQDQRGAAVTDTDHYFISRAEQQQLAELLDTILALIDDLTRARVGSRKWHLTC